MSLSLLSSQLLWFSGLGIVALLICAFLLRLSPARWSGPRCEGMVFPAVVAMLASGAGVLRLVAGSAKNFDVVVFFLMASLIVVVMIARAKLSIAGGEYSDRHQELGSMVSVWAVTGVLVASFVLPDIYSGVLRRLGSAGGNKRKSPNVVLLVMDTVRADHLSCYGYDRNATPNIDRISTEGVLYLKAFSPAPWTLPSHASMFTGLFPSEHQAEWTHPHLNESFETLAERLAEYGFRTVGMTESPFTGRSHGLAQGFGEYHEMWRRPLVVRAAKKVGRELDLYRDTYEYSGATVGRFRRWVRNHQNDQAPFFAFINLMAAHLPNYPQPGADLLNVTKEDLERIEPVNQVPERHYVPKYHLDSRELAIMEEIYDGEISLLDRRVGEVLEFLRDAGLLDDTVIVLTSDHGENFGDHGLIEHQFCLYNSLIHVPLIIRYPAGLLPEQVETPISTASLFQTIISLVDRPEDQSNDRIQEALSSGMRSDPLIVSELGDSGNMLRNLISDEAPDFDFTAFEKEMRSLVVGSWKYISSSDGTREVYNIEIDFDEDENLIDSQHAVTFQLAGVLTQWEESIDKRVLPDVVGEVDQETRDALRALGYEQ